MASRNYAQVAPTAATIALNAYIYGYGGHSLVTPHAALKQLWWTDARIEAKVTRAFVVSKLRGEEREFLDRPLAFGEGLTDDSYMDWILDRAKRLFLILTEIGVPDQIFGCIDDSWGDDDLPLPLKDVPSLELSYENDPVLNKRFYDMQFVYLLRELNQGSHVDYGPREHIPMEHVNLVPPAISLQPYDRIHFPGRTDEIYMRRKFALTDKETGDSHLPHLPRFLRDVRKARVLSHEHIANCWASYTSEKAGFIVSDFVPEHTLGTFIEHRTAIQYMRVSAMERPILLCEWMHCLADALASLHHRGVAHTAIRPSNIWITRDNKIAFADVGSLSTFQRNKKCGKTEAYDYAAPESRISKTPVRLKASPPPRSSLSAFSKLRKMSTQSFATEITSSSSSSGGSSIRSNSVCSDPTIGSPFTPPSLYSDPHTSSKSTAVGSEPLSPASIRNFSRHIPTSHPSGSTDSWSPGSIQEAMLLPRLSTINPDSLRDLPTAAPEMSDIWSLACVFLDIITFMIKGKITEFVKFRTGRITTGRNNKYRTDTSFHNEPDKISAWIDTLEGESVRHGEQVYRAVPELLHLVRSMMSQNAVLRPTASDVRDRIQDVLLDHAGVEQLCCLGRVWPEVTKAQLRDDESTISPRRGRHDSPVVDELSVATGMLDLEGGGRDLGARPGGFADPYGGSDHISLLSRTESMIGDDHQRRRMSVSSTATTKLSNWRTRFFST